MIDNRILYVGPYVAIVATNTLKVMNVTNGAIEMRKNIPRGYFLPEKQIPKSLQCGTNFPAHIICHLGKQ